MRKLSYFFVILIGFTFTGCIDFIEEIFLNKDGSGQYIITIDASSIMAGGGLRGMMQMAGEDAANSLPDEPIEKDSVIYFKNADATLKSKMKHPEILDRISIHQQMSEQKELMKTTFTFDFNNMAEIDYFLQDLGNLATSGEDLGGMDGMMQSFVGGKTVNNLPLFVQSKKMVTRNKTEVSKEFAEMLGAGGEAQEGMEMVKMMMADATYKVIYHLPGTVKSTTMKDARIDGKDVIVEFDLLDSMEGKADLSGVIKHKKK